MPGTPIPTLFLGRFGSSPGEAEVFLWGTGNDDGADPGGGGGDAIVFLAKTVRFVPAL